MAPKPTECEGVDPSFRALEDLWRERVNHARRRYMEKSVISDALAAECQRLVPCSDPLVGLAFRWSLWLQSGALQRYRQVLRMYTDLVVRGIVPPE